MKIMILLIFFLIFRVILEDRRIRLNYWVSSLILKPIERFKNPKLIDKTLSKEKLSDVKSIHFTINRKIPLSLTFQKEDIKFVLIYISFIFLK